MKQIICYFLQQLILGLKIFQAETILIYKQPSSMIPTKVSLFFLLKCTVCCYKTIFEKKNLNETKHGQYWITFLINKQFQNIS